MNIQCPSCGKTYKIPDDKIKAAGVRVKCKQCESSLVVKPDGAVSIEGGAAAAGPSTYALVGPDGSKLGPFPLETVKARIEVGEVTREWQAGPVGGPLIAIADLPELAGVEWPAPGYDDFGFGGDAPAAAAPAAGGDDFGFDDFGGDAPAAAAPAAGGDDFGFDDFGGDAPAAAAPAAGGDDFGFDDFGGDAPAAAAPAAGGDDFGFDDFGSDAPAATAPAAGGDDFGFDDFGGDAPAATAPAAGGDDQFDDFGGFVDAPAKPSGNNALDALFDAPGGDLDEGAFGFDESAPAGSAGGKVYYEEDFDHEFGDEVVRQVEAAAEAPAEEPTSAADGIYGWQDDTAEAATAAPAADDELITTLEQLSKARPASKMPIIIGVGSVVGVVAIVAGLIFAVPGVARQLPGLEALVLDVHESMNSEFHQARVVEELLGAAKPQIETWIPSKVRAGLAPLEMVVRDVPDRTDAIDLLARARFFLALVDLRAAQKPPIGTPVAAAYAAALAGTPVPEGVEPASDRMLAQAYADWRAGHVTEAVAPLTMATGLAMPQKLFVPVLSAVIAADGQDLLGELTAWQQAMEAAPANPWISLRAAWAIWNLGERPAETKAAIEEARRGLAQLDAAEAASLHELAARVALLEGRHADAQRETTEGLKRQPKNAVLMSLKGRAHLNLKQWAEANLVLDDALAAKPGLPEAIVAKADALIGIDRADEGLAMLEAANRDQPGEPLFARRYLTMLVERNRLADAENVYIDAARRFPDDSQLVRIGADVALARNDIEAAQRRLDDFRRDNPNDLSVVVKLAEISLRRGQLTQAESRLREIVDGDAQNVPARIKLGEVLLLRGRPDEAEKVLLDARDLASDNPQIYGHLARSFLDRKDTKAAMEMLQEGMRLNSSIWSLHLLTGEALFLDGKINDAIYSFDKAAELSSGAVPVLLWQAKGYAASGRPGKAMDFYRAVLEKEPDNVEALRELTIGEMQVDQWANAQELADRWRKAQPGSAEPYLWAGRARLSNGDIDGAIKVLESGLARRAGSADLHSEIGWAWLQKKQTSKAAKHLTQARKLAPKDGLVLLRVGYLFKAQNRPRDAEKAFQAAMKAEISDEDKAKAKTELDTLAY
jgi:predicted Zn finger-like uncharacterized protein